MDSLPPLPTFDDRMEVTETIQVEVESEGVRLLFEFLITVDVTFDPDAEEVVIECREEQVDQLN